MYRIFTFFIILFFCVIPPIFAKATEITTFANWTFPLQQICYAFFAAILLWFSRDLESPIKPPFYKQLLIAIITFFLLILVSFIVQKLATLMGETKSYSIQKPSEILSIVYCIMNFLFSAFYEEVIYRFFLPETMKRIIKGFLHQSGKNVTLQSDKAVWHHFDLTDFLCDFVSLVLFALAHLYMGFFSVLNAAAAYAILRFCFKRTKNIFTGTISHFVYNLIQLFVSPL